MNRISTRTLAGLVLAASLAFAGPSLAVLYTAGTWSSAFPGPYTPPPDAPHFLDGLGGYPGDTVSLLGHSGSLNLAPGTYVQKLNTLDWIIHFTWGGDAAYNAQHNYGLAWPDLLIDFTMVSDFTIGTANGTISQGGRLRINWDNDFISLAEGTASLFVVDGYTVRVTPLAIAEVGGSNFSGNPGWNQPDLNVMARFEVEEVPEPTTLAMAGVLLAFAAGCALRSARRKRRA